MCNSENKTGRLSITRKKSKPHLTIPEKITEHLELPIPVIQTVSQTFIDSTQIQFYRADKLPGIRVYDKRIVEDPITGERHTQINSREFLSCDTSQVITRNKYCKAVSFNKSGQTSKPAQCAVFRRTEDILIISKTPADKPYNQFDREGLLDGLKGSVDFRTGRWLGFQGKTFQAVFDVKTIKNIRKIDISCLQDTKSWIWFPSSFEVEISDDGQTFVPAGLLLNQDGLLDNIPQQKTFTIEINKSCRFIRITLKPAFNEIPSWHPGTGGKPWIFLDEVEIR